MSISVSLAVVIPFYAASVVETVQSDIASEKPGIFDVFQEGIYRFLSWSAPQTGKKKKSNIYMHMYVAINK